MSADNGIYILITPVSTGSIAKQYRVVHSQNIEEICWDKQAKKLADTIQPEMLMERFGNASPFSDECVAYKRAFKMARDIRDEGAPLEYGVSEIEYDKPFPT